MLLLIANETTDQGQKLLQEPHQQKSYPMTDPLDGIRGFALVRSPSPESVYPLRLQPRRTPQSNQGLALSAGQSPSHTLEENADPFQEHSLTRDVIERLEEVQRSGQGLRHPLPEKEVSKKSSRLVSPKNAKHLSPRSKDVPFVPSCSTLTSEASSASQTPRLLDPKNPNLHSERRLPQRESPVLQQEAANDDDDAPPPLPRKETRRNALIFSPEEGD